MGRTLLLLVLSTSLCAAWVAQAPHRPSIVSSRRAAAAPIQAQAPEQEPDQKPTGMTPERRRFEEEGTGFLFFQGATPKTGVQEGMPDFFSEENFANSGEIVLTQKAVFGTFAVLFLGLVVTLITA